MQDDDARPATSEEASTAAGEHLATPTANAKAPGERPPVQRVDLQSSHEQRGAAMSDSEIVRKLWSFVVPSGKPEFRRRVAVSMAFLVASKGLNVGVRIIL